MDDPDRNCSVHKTRGPVPEDDVRAEYPADPTVPSSDRGHDTRVPTDRPDPAFWPATALRRESIARERLAFHRLLQLLPRRRPSRPLERPHLRQVKTLQSTYANQAIRFQDLECIEHTNHRCNQGCSYSLKTHRTSPKEGAEVKQTKTSRGNILLLFNDKKRFIKYVSCIAVGVPIWYTIGVLILFSPEIAQAHGITGVKSGDAIMYFYMATSVGDFLCAYLSQVWKSRKKALITFLIMTSVFAPVYLYMLDGATVFAFYCVCALLGFATGYWAVFVTTASEQFGTNLRATVTTTVPNMVRGSLAVLTLLLGYFKDSFGFSHINATMCVGLIAIGIAYLSLFGLKETYAKDLNYIES